MEVDSIHQFDMERIRGDLISIADFVEKKILIVNVASKWFNQSRGIATGTL